MRSKLSDSFCFLLVALLFIAQKPSSAQAVSDVAFFLNKYPGNSVVYELETKDMEITMKKGKPVVKVTHYSSRIVLQDNATVLSSYKYYFNKTLDPPTVQAYSMVLDGDHYKRVPVRDYLQTTEFDDGNFYDDLAAYTFHFNTVGKGTKLVVESESGITDPFSTLVFWFGHFSPVYKARLTLSFPPEVKVMYRLFGGADTSNVKFSCEKKGRLTVCTWESNELKGYDQDKVAPDDRYFTPHIILQIAGYTNNGDYLPVFGSLKDLYNHLYKNLRDTLTPTSGPIKKLGDSLTMGLDQTEQKVAAIYQWVQGQIRYIAIEDGENGHVPCDPELVLQRRYGDCKGKTSLLVTLMRSQGIRSSYAWIGTRELPYRFTEFPTRAGSNHMVAVWWKDKNEPVVLDGTTQYHSLYEIPSSIQGKECLIERGVKDYTVFRIPVAPPVANTCTDSISVSIDNGTLSGRGLATIKGERKATLLHAFNRVDTSQYRNIITSQLPKASNKFIVGKISTTSITETTQPLQINYSFSVPDYVKEVNNKVYINMNLDRFPGSLAVEDERSIPVEAEQTFNNIFTCTLTIPDGYIADKIPENSTYSDPVFGFSQEYLLSGNLLILQTRVYIGFQVIDGPKIKQFSDMLSSLRRAYTRSVVLIKK